MGECYKRGRAFQGKQSSSRTPVSRLWAAKSGEQCSYSGAPCALSCDPAQESRLWGHLPLWAGQSLTLEQRGSATAIQDPLGFLSTVHATSIHLLVPAGQSVSTQLSMSCSGSSTTQTEKTWSLAWRSTSLAERQTWKRVDPQVRGKCLPGDKQREGGGKHTAQ